MQPERNIEAGRTLRPLILISVDFFSWPLALIQEMSARGFDVDPTFFVVNDTTVTAALRQKTKDSTGAIICQSELERLWVARKPDVDALHAWRSRLGNDAVEAVALADRDLSAAYVTGGIFPETPLARIARDPAARATYVAALLGTLDDLFNRKSFDCVLSYPTQDASSAAAGVLADQYGIPFLTLKAIGLAAKSCYFDDMKTMAPVFRHTMAKFAAATEQPEAAVLAEAEAILDRMRNRPQQPDYMRLANATIDEKPGLLLTGSLIYRTITRRPPDNLRYPFPWARLVFEYRRWWNARRQRRHKLFGGFDRLDGKRFFYFPLHYEPEASTMVSAPESMDQLAVISDIVAGLPDGTVLAVKEHVPMIGRRPARYYEKLTALPNLVLLDPRISSFEMIRRALATVTITGTAGFEAVLAGRSAVFLGPSPVQILPKGFVGPIDRTDLGSVLSDATRMAPASDVELLNFLAALIQESADISASDVWGGTAVITPDRLDRRQATIRRCADLLLGALRKT